MFTNSSSIILTEQWDSALSDIDNAQNGVDLALIRLDRPVTGITPATLYTGSDEIGRIAYWIGYGSIGNGTSGEDPATFGVRYGMENVLDERGDDD